VPVCKIPLNHVPYVPSNEPLLGILDKFQEGRSHMAIVSRFSVEKAASVKKVIKRGLTQRLRDRVGMGDSSNDEDDKADEHGRHATENGKREGTEDTAKEDDSKGDNGNVQDAGPKPQKRVRFRRRGRARKAAGDPEAGIVPDEEANEKESKEKEKEAKEKNRLTVFVTGHGLEQCMPADAVLAKEGAEEVCNFLSFFFD
jgi:metal transporter CNNM